MTGRVPLAGRVRHDQRGSATVTVLALSAVLVVIAMVGGAVGALLVGQRRAAAAADLAALAAAQALASTSPVRYGGDPCGAARRVTRENGAHLAACGVDGREVRVRVVVRVAGPLGAVWQVPGEALAGPSASAGPAR